jgi:23S rRNA (adenine2503-C2)-methyltransferase
VIHVARWLKDRAESEPEKEGERKRATEKRITNGKETHFVTNVVYMGMGEPMNNYDNVLQSVRILNDAKGLAIGIRHISISTCGIVPGILKLAEEPFQVNLAISLHAATDETRSKIMPVNRAYAVKKLMDAVDQYVEKTNRKVLFEYLMLDGVNDSRADADALAKLLAHKKHLYQVNVIKYHDTGLFKSTNESGRLRFVEWLREKGVLVTHRRTFGEDIDAACGQLAVAEENGQMLEGKVAAKKNREKRNA